MTQEWDWDNIRFYGGIDTERNPRTYTFQSESFCPVCNSPKTYIEKIKLKKYMGSEIKSFQYLLNHIKENNLGGFTIKDLMNSMNITHLSDGGLQRKLLSVLVVLGYFTRYIEEFENKKGEKKIRYLFSKNSVVLPPPCYDVVRDVHSVVEWKKTTYFDSKANKKDDTKST